MGPRSLGVALLTASFVGMVFTIQVETAHTPVPVRELRDKAASGGPTGK